MSSTTNKTKASKRVKVLDRSWTLKFTHYPELGLAKLGDCDDPTETKRQIRVSDSLDGRETFRVLLHELTHAAFWWLDEKFVDQYTKDATEILFSDDVRARWDR